MSTPAEDIAALVRARGFALPADVREVARLAEESGLPAAHGMVGDLIQLLDETSEYDLADAEAAYLRAIEIDPTYAEGYSSLGYFYDAVNDDPERARPYFEKAIALGDTAAEEGLESVLEQLGG
jgi:tetratricopeptide (TPR) repeat protein